MGVRELGTQQDPTLRRCLSGTFTTSPPRLLVILLPGTDYAPILEGAN